MMDLLKVAKQINLKITELESLKEQLPLLAKRKSDTMVAYEKALALATMELGTSQITYNEKIAKGKCADLKGEMDLAESLYKNCIKIIDITESQMNGYQSINRYLSEL